ncbi:GntR family transcriptional regulator / MocR family aminotransferase [Pseudonocardia thermophila]|uniref:GntR family transcriptional regulator / MocR family aminotransferase n=1 Tax=Pseudonocardia thermophila TaxID=1848 RepID=A0A1M6SJ83_PSETH|nr:PLP-dependent aminotransferase family protein [Pseudonocardia thermophila]SHK44765.1 GntR family transcriptional regulator / MocR family aminotransferase [Pseudonocardia thermophila]
MTVDWGGIGPELLLRLDRSLPEPLRTQLLAALRDAIRSGRLRAGERLPSSRELARQLEVSRGLVQETYEQLLAEGYLTSRTGSGTRVAAVHSDVEQARVEPEAPAAPRFEYDFAVGVPDLGSFPRADWAWAVREALRTLPNADLGYLDTRGHPELRRVLAGYLRRVRAAAADPARTVICAGFAQGIELTRRVLQGMGVRRIAFEDPGYSDHTVVSAMSGAGMEPVPVPVDDDGIDVAALAASGAQAVVVTPAHQWPTGVVLSPRRRRELVAWARDHDAYIVEDDYDAEFRYDKEPVGVVQGLAPQRVIMIGTTSKALAPGLRLAWLVCPPALTDALVTEKLLADRGSPVIDQVALAAMISSGRYDRQLRRMRGIYAARREALVDELRTQAPAVGISGLAAGFHAVAHLPAGVSEADAVAGAAARSVGVSPMSAYRADRSPEPPQLVLGLGTMTERAVRIGVRRIADLLAGARSSGVSRTGR